MSRLAVLTPSSRRLRHHRHLLRHHLALLRLLPHLHHVAEEHRQLLRGRGKECLDRDIVDIFRSRHMVPLVD
jgi:hypothetical protein